MRKRLYFLVPDVSTAQRIRDDLLLSRIEDCHCHVLAKEGIGLADLHEASILQKSDMVHGAELGLITGGGGWHTRRTDGGHVSARRNQYATGYGTDHGLVGCLVWGVGLQFESQFGSQFTS